MSPKLLKRVEFAANLAIIVTSLLLCTVLVKTFFLSPPTSAAGSRAVSEERTRVGETLSIPGLEWSGGGPTLVLALSSDCGYCTASGPFYQRLAQRRGEVRLVAVTPQKVEDGRKYLEKLGVSVNEVIQVPLESIGVQGTPTLFLVDGSGSVTGAWVGRLPAEREAEVLDRLQGRGGS